jgi:hypothetical protein
MLVKKNQQKKTKTNPFISISSNETKSIQLKNQNHEERRKKVRR